MHFLQTTALLFLVFDCIGNIPLFLALLQNQDNAGYRRILIRESLISIAILAAFLLTGDLLFRSLGIDPASLGIAGGILLFLISLRMIFHKPEAMFELGNGEDPLVVPIAVPSIVGPSAITTVLLLRNHDPDSAPMIFASIVLAMLLSLCVYLAARKFAKRLGNRFFNALQKLMGLLLSIIAVNMAVVAIRGILSTAGH